MKAKLKRLAVLACLFIGISGTMIAQERPEFLTVTTVHWNMDNEDFSMDEWKAVEKEYFDKVTMKNEYIVSFIVLNHYFTEDNSEIKFVTGFSSWENIEKSVKRSDELAKEGWPDEKAREAFFKKQSAYYSNMHSDEIYSTLDGAKILSPKPSKAMVYYIRKSHRAFPEDGKPEEIQALRKEYKENVIDKNKYVKGYYPSRHAWGSDGRDFIEAFVVESLGDLALSMEENQKLVKDHWPDEKKADEFFDKMDKYMTGFHADYIYRHVPELMK
jgi:hypothetical protein